MKNYTIDIIRELMHRLSTAGVPIKTVVEDNPNYPFILLSNITFGELPLKNAFRYYGTFVVLVENRVDGSILDALNLYGTVKSLIQPQPTGKLFRDMVYLKLNDDTGIFEVQPNSKIYRGILTYEYEIVDDCVGGGVIPPSPCANSVGGADGTHYIEPNQWMENCPMFY